MAQILYLDDEEAIVLLMTRMLEILGHRVVGHTRAAEALAAFRENPAAFDLVLTDLAMPGASGLEFAQQVRAIRPDVAIAAASGSVEPRDMEAASAQGMLAVVMKPRSIEEMSSTIGGLLEKAGVTTGATE